MASRRRLVTAAGLVAIVAVLCSVGVGSVDTAFGPVPFDVLDADGDGVVTRDEYDGYVQSLAKDPNVVLVPTGKASGKSPGEKSDMLAKQLAAIQQPAMDFWGAFLNSIAMIIVTELGDKTFFIAAILAMQHERLPVFIGAIGALAAMTVLSAAIGFALPNLLPRVYTHYAASVLFGYFGFRLLKDAYDMDTTQPNEELEEVEQELGTGKKEDVESGAGNGAGAGVGGSTENQDGVSPKMWSIIWKSFTLTFLAEWGDRSQVATIALATAKDPFGVTLGGVLGHSMCTGLAVIGGRLLATKISERTVAIAGGVLFLIFAVHSLWAGPEDVAM